MKKTTQPKPAPCGSWPSPITAALLATAGRQLQEVRFDGADLYWSEGRPEESGRVVVMRRRGDGEIGEVSPPAPFNVRTRAHEYGGGAFIVHRGILYASNFADQRLYRVRPGKEPEPLTPAGTGARYADAIMDEARERLICVEERPCKDGGEPRSRLVAVGLSGGGEPVVLAEGHDFLASPRLSPDGRRLAWLTWDHPRMPWDGTELHLAELARDGQLKPAARVAGGPEESIFQPEWSPEGELFCISDRSGWWNLYRCGQDGLECLWKREAEFGQPQWAFAMSTYGFVGPEQILCSHRERGAVHLALLDVRSGAVTPVGAPLGSLRGLRTGADGKAAFLGGTPTEQLAVHLLDHVLGEALVVRRSSDERPGEEWISVPEPVEFAGADGATAHGFFYAAKNPGHVALPGERPPLLVRCHGGPTAATASVLNLGIQYWTSRGIAVLDVDYGGSTGYGRAYRERLRGRWGDVDVEDCTRGALHCAAAGWVDGGRLCIEGGSAGGYTTLACLTFRDVFRAGASHYGVSDLEALAHETHKFESHYLDALIGPLPEAAQQYRERSPLHHADQLSCPVIFFQGKEDRIVPPAQAEVLVGALKAKGLPVAYLCFEGEQHGFRKAASIRRVHEAQLAFFGRVLGFEPADRIEPVAIAHEAALPAAPRPGAKASDL
ncbi:MAG: S9 family peptidase [Puniceicoccaceae bacterium]|nr:MAG: S9 family peptidase [Puniceicoccaceae bacterium]